MQARGLQQPWDFMGFCGTAPVTRNGDVAHGLLFSDSTPRKVVDMITSAFVSDQAVTVSSLRVSLASPVASCTTRANDVLASALGVRMAAIDSWQAMSRTRCTRDRLEQGMPLSAFWIARRSVDTPSGSGLPGGGGR